MVPFGGLRRTGGRGLNRAFILYDEPRLKVHNLCALMLYYHTFAYYLQPLWALGAFARVARYLSANTLRCNNLERLEHRGIDREGRAVLPTLHAMHGGQDEVIPHALIDLGRGRMRI